MNKIEWTVPKEWSGYSDLGKSVKNKSSVINERNLPLYFKMRDVYDNKRAKLFIKNKIFNNFIDERLCCYKGNVRRVRRRIEIDIKKLQETGIGGPLPKNTVCRFIGITPKYIGSITPKPVKPDALFNMYMQNLRKRGEFKGLVEIWKNKFLEYREVWTAGMAGGFSNLIRMADDKIGCPLKYDEILNILSQEALDKFFGRTPINMPTPDKDRLDEIIRVRPDSSPGLFTKTLFGPRRFDSLNNSCIISKTFLNLLEERGFGNYTLWEILGREKAMKTTDDNKEVNTRLVLNMEEPLLLINLLYAQPDRKSVV